MSILVETAKIRNHFPVFKTGSKQFSAFRLNFAICNDNLQTLGSRRKKRLGLKRFKATKGTH